MKDNYNTNFNQEPQLLTKETAEFLQKTLLRYKKSRNRVQNLLLNHKDNLNLSDGTLERVSDCGSWLEFRNYYQKDKTKLHNANFCKKDKLCPACATRRASKQVKKVMEHIEHNPGLKDKKWYYIVLPVDHNIDEDFSTVFERARKGLQKIKRSIQNSKTRKTQESFFAKFDGLFYSFEVTKSKNGWNVHINLLCCTDEDIQGIYKYKQKDGKITSQHRDIMLDWSKFTDNESFIHSINKLSDDNMMGNLVEVFKYALKFQSLEDEDLVTVYKETQNKRLLGAFGSLYGIKTNVPLSGDEILDDVYIEIIYRCNSFDSDYVEYSRTKKHEPRYHKLLFSPSLSYGRGSEGKVVEKSKNKNKFIKIHIYDINGNISTTIKKPIIANISDYDIFANSIYEQQVRHRRYKQ